MRPDTRPPRARLCRLLAAAAVGALAAGCIAEDEPPPPAETTPPPQAETSPSPPAETPEADSDLLSSQGISAAHPLAVEAGEQILDDGGNAVDAAVAAAFAVSVVEPFASGIGGGGATLIAGQEGDPVYYDYREVVAEDGEVPDSGTGVPGFVAGMETLHAEHGNLEWDQLLAPAHDLAEQGFEVSEFLALRMSAGYGPDAVGELEHYSPDGTTLTAGEQLVQQDLAATLQTLAEEGPESFYTGDLVSALTEVDGLDAESLSNYEVMTAEPVAGEFGDHEVLSAAPPLPGVSIIELLQVAEAQGAGDADPESADYIRTLSEAWESAEETALTELGDPNFVEVPTEELTDPQNNGALEGVALDGAVLDDASSESAAQSSAASAQSDPAGAAEEVRPADGSSPNTTHITAVDSDGVVVSMTNTITNFWGSGETVGGFFLNNQLSRFEAIDSPANRPEPGRRSVSWAGPTMVLDAEGRPVLGIGTPGGVQIPNILGTVLVQWGLQDRELDQALASPRFRFDTGPQLLEIEEQPSAGATQELEGLGWGIEVSPPDLAVFGSVQALEVDYESGAVTGTDDPRREGAHSIIETD